MRRLAVNTVLVIIVLSLTGCTIPKVEDQDPSAITGTASTQETEATEPPIAVMDAKGFMATVQLVKGFRYKDFEVAGVPTTQTASVPPVWTGESKRGERHPDDSPTHARLHFSSPTAGVLLIVDITLAPHVQGTGILNTTWVSGKNLAKYDVCTECYSYHSIEFYEPSVVYTVTAISNDGEGRELYPFTDGLMKALKDSPKQGE